MLTIQPKISNYQHQPTKALSFKGEQNPDAAYFEEKIDFYENQIKEYDEAIEDKYTPKPLKKIMKGFRIISEALLEGWAVAWGASKGSKLLKSSIVNTANSKAIHKADGVIKPIIQGVKQSIKNIAKYIANGFTSLKNSKAMKSVSEFFSKTAENLNKNKFGKGVVKCFEAIGSGFKYLGKKISKGWNNIVDACSGKNAEATYDKVTKGTSKVFGVGAGIAGGYNAATNADERELKRQERKETTDQQVIDKDYNDGLEAALEDLEDDE